MTEKDGRVELLIDIRKKAEAVVADMPDGPVKVAAFELAFTRLAETDEKTTSARKPRRGFRRGGMGPSGDKGKKARKKGGPKAHIGELIAEGFFEKGQTVGDVVHGLLVNGHKYPRADVSATLRRLTQEKKLRRKKDARGPGNKKVWAYEA